MVIQKSTWSTWPQILKYFAINQNDIPNYKCMSLEVYGLLNRGENVHLKRVLEVLDPSTQVFYNQSDWYS